MTRHGRRVGQLVALVAVVVPAHAAKAEVLEIKGDPQYLYVTAVNNGGYVVGQGSYNLADPDAERRGFVFSKSSGITKIDSLGAIPSQNASSSASDINNANQIAGGTTFNDECYPGRGAVFTTGGAVERLFSGWQTDQGPTANCEHHYQSSAVAINDAGFVLGPWRDEQCYGQQPNGMAWGGQPGLANPG